MKIGLAQCVNKGMQRDYSMDKASQEFAYENRNIRITTNGDESFLSVTNEKSTKNIPLDSLNLKYGLGIILGSATLEDDIIIFSKIGEYDAIILIEPTKINEAEEVSCKYIYGLNSDGELAGNLNFNIENPIECIALYEADDVKKVYWVDGINQPRVINICNTYDIDALFDFTPNIPDGIKVNIEKEYNGSGNFVSGVIQYFITFYNKFGSESGVAYESPLFYISSRDRGGEVNEKHTCSFKISISLEDSSFEYARVYSIIRTSYNSTPQAYLVKDVQLNDSSKSVQVIDTNTLNTPIASTDLMFVGGNSIIAKTIEQKDNTLFLGDITEKTSDAIAKIKEWLNTGNTLGELKFGSKFIPSNEYSNTYYPYSPNLNLSSRDIKTFKYLEWYKIGIQFQLHTGEWTSVLEIGDIQNTVKPNTQTVNTPYDEDTEFDKEGIWLPALSFTPSDSFVEKLGDIEDIKNWRLVMAEHNQGTRTIKAQGLVLPTIFNLEDRSNNTCYANPLWTVNSVFYTNHLGNIDAGNEGTFSGEKRILSMYPFFHLPLSAYYSKGDDFYKLDSAVVETNPKKITIGDYLTSVQPIIVVDRDYGSWCDRFKCRIKIGVKQGEVINYYEIEIYNDSAPYGQRRSRLASLSSAVSNKIWGDIWGYSIGDKKIEDIDNISQNDQIFWPGEIPSGNELRDNYGVKPANDITINSLPTYVRDIVYSKNLETLENHGNQYFLDASVCNFISPDSHSVDKGLKFRVVGFTDIVNSISDYTINVENNVVDTKIYKEPVYNLNTFKMDVASKNYFAGIKSLPLWPYNNRLHYIHYWSNGGNIIKNDVVDFVLKSKKFANMWFCGNTTYASPIDYGNISDLQLVNNETTLLNNIIYKADYQNVLVPTASKRSFVGGDDVNGKPSKQPMNETTPLEVLAEGISYVYCADYPKEFIEDVPNIGSINIKHKTSEHVAFALPKSKKGIFSILPNYKPHSQGNGLVYSNTIYPLGGLSVDIIASFSTAVNYVLKQENDVAYRLYVEPDAIKIVGEDKNEMPKTFIELDIKDYISPEVILVDKKQNVSQPLVNEIYSQVIDSTEYDDEGKPVKSSAYKDRTFLFALGDNNMYLVASIIGDFHVSDVTWFASAPINFRIVDLNTPILYYNNDDSFLLNNEEVDESLLYKTFRFYNFSIAESPYTEDTLYSDSGAKLFIGEFYTEYNKDTFFGGDSKNCKFIPISEAYPIGTQIGWGLEGDTYYQRYDNVRIYESGSEDVNQNIDAVSFMLETYQNLDGDYRKLRGRLNTTTLTVENTNDIRNDVYSQINNYTASYILDERFEDSTHPTLYAWSLSKQALANIDTWTAINLSSSMKLDGDKGVLTKIKRWNNHLLAFQEKGVAVINFNQQTTISNAEGVPIEIANSGKVTGHYYISSTQGCKNKWSIVDSPYGLYFIDSYNKSINVFNSDGIKSLSTINLFQDWIVDNEKGFIWNPVDNKGFKSFYDPIHKEAYFINDETALCYNELLGQFTSFYDYANLNTMVPVNGHIYGFKDGEMHLMFEGDDYCNLFGEQVDFSMTYKLNKDTYIDKIWTNVEYKADIFDSGNINNTPELTSRDTFDTLTVWNEYQKGVANLKGSRYPNARCKFRVWRADIPRDDVFKRDRIRNTWIMLKLEKSSNTNKRMEFHDLVVKYLQ